MQRTQIQKKFKLNGLSLDPKALDYLHKLVTRVDAPKQDKVVNRIIDSLINLNLENPKISLAQCEDAIKVCKTESNYESEVLSTVSAFRLPKIYFNHEMKKFLIDSSSSHIFSNECLQRAKLYNNRYDIVYQSLVQNQIFKNLSEFRISPIESLQHTSATKEFVVFGMLVKVSASKFVLEDTTGIIDLNLDRASFHSTLCPEGCFVLVEGTVSDRTLQVTGIGLPTLVSKPYSNVSSKTEASGIRQITLPDPLCGINTLSQLETLHKVMTCTQTGADSMVILLGRVTLNSCNTMSRLIQLFNGFAATNPNAFIMYGNFITTKSKSSSKFNSKQIKTLQTYLKQLLVVYCTAFPEPKIRPHLILIPGPNDPTLSPSRVLPSAPLNPNCIPTEYHRDLANPEDLFDSDVASSYAKMKGRKWIHLGTNPLRMRIFNKTAIFFTAEYSKIFFKNSINSPEDGNLCQENNENEVYGEALKQCIISQQHLLPLPIEISLVHWNYDSALSIFPGPDLVCICDPSSMFNFPQDNDENQMTHFVSLKNFGDLVSSSQRDDEAEETTAETGNDDKKLGFDFNFKVWYPTSCSVEDSRLPDV